MDQTPTIAQKLRRRFRLQPGCMLPLIPIIFLAACYGSIWLFAWYGGEWAMSDQIPVPPESQPLGVIYGDAAFMMKSAFYAHAWNPEPLRDWFVEQGATLQGYEIDTFARKLHRSAVQYIYPETRWIGSRTVGCTGWTVFEDPHEIAQVFEGFAFDVPQGKTVFAIHTCWMNARQGL